MGKSHTETLPYWPSDNDINTGSRGLIFSRIQRKFEVNELFIHNIAICSVFAGP